MLDARPRWSTGPDRVDLMKALVTWTEQGIAPSRPGIVHTKLDAGGKPSQTRPLCKFPAYARYVGSGDPNAAAGFSCSTQQAAASGIHEQRAGGAWCGRHQVTMGSAMTDRLIAV